MKTGVGDGERVEEEKEGIGIHHTCRGALQLYITVRSAYAARAAYACLQTVRSIHAVK